MYKYRKIISIVAAMLILFGVLAFSSADRARAIAPGIYEIDGNAECSTLYLNKTYDLAALGPLMGIKYDSYLTNGVDITHNLTDDPPWKLEDGSPSDVFNEITISNVQLSEFGQVFDWSATLELDAVIVKGGPDSNAYVYIPPTFGDEGLHAPENASGDYANVSHISFCYNYELTATKTANASYTRTYTWDITKDFDGEYWKFIGDSADTHGYKVSVARTETDSDFAVSGDIVVSNPTPFTVGFSVADSVGGVTADVTCPTYSLDPGMSTTCTYSAALAGPVDGTNTATITSTTAGVGGATATDGYTFGEPTSIVGFPTVNVTDTNGLAWTASGDASWDYTRDFTCPTDPKLYVDGVYSFTHVNTAEITETDQTDDATVKVHCYAPVVSKTAAGTYDEVHYWDVTKTVDPLSQSGFIGDTVYFDWTIKVDEDVVDENHAITGKISVFNPATMPMTVSISDVLDDGTTVTLGCGGTLTILAGETGECSYSASPDDKSATLNTATATLNSIDFVAKADVEWSKTVVDDSVMLYDDQYPYMGQVILENWSTTYSDSYTCSTKLTDYDEFGKDLNNQVDNTAIIKIDGEEVDSSKASTLIDCYIPAISKTAAGTYDERHEWDVEKTVNPESQSAFIGDTVTFDWTITVTEDVFEENFDVAGKITVVNPNPEDALVVNLSDELSDGTVASITGCTGGTFVEGMLTVPASGTAFCDYEANNLGYTDVDSAPNLNTASFYLNSVLFSDDDPIEYTANVIRGSATLDDDQFPYSGEEVYDGWTNTYEDSYTCSTDLGDYTKGMDLDNEVVNTAEVYSGGALEDSSTAKTYIDCYAPVVEKTAVASYDETHTWTIEKSASDPVSGYPGDTLNWTWTVNVSEKSADSNFKVVGEIKIHNPSLDEMTVSVVDQLNDGTTAVVDCGEGVDETAVIVPAGATVTCSYEALPSGKTAIENKATVGFNGLSFTAYADVNFVANVIDGTATVNDDQIGLNELITAGNGPWEFSGSGSHVCSSEASAYDEFGKYGEILDNTAVVRGSDGQTDSDDASTSYLCEAGFVDLLKHTNGMIDSTKDWKFALYLGPDGFGTTPIGTSSTFGDADGILDFGGPALRPDKTYTICELSVPAGYTTFWQINGSTVIPYNPNANDSPPEVLGNYCFDFTPTVVGETIHFYVDNQEGGGDPRTPGYWKNWNTCTGGGQAATAAANGGWEDGFWLLDDVLNPAITGGITWDVILSDSFTFPINSCELAVSILNTKDFNSGKVLASDPGYNLAKHLLAAQLNFGAGACKPAFDVLGDKNIDEVALAAEELLDKYDFDAVGEGISKKKKDDAALALQLATILDKYNNGMYCGSTYVP